MSSKGVTLPAFDKLVSIKGVVPTMKYWGLNTLITPVKGGFFTLAVRTGRSATGIPASSMKVFEDSLAAFKADYLEYETKCSVGAQAILKPYNETPQDVFINTQFHMTTDVLDPKGIEVVLFSQDGSVTDLSKLPLTNIRDRLGADPYMVRASGKLTMYCPRDTAKPCQTHFTITEMTLMPCPTPVKFAKKSMTPTEIAEGNAIFNRSIAMFGL